MGSAAIAVLVDNWFGELSGGRLTTAPPPMEPAPSGATSPYGRRVLEAELDTIAKAAPGTRNHVLNERAFRVFQLVAGGEIAEAEATYALSDAGAKIGLGAAEVANTLGSARRGGWAQPRCRPEDDLPAPDMTPRVVSVVPDTSVVADPGQPDKPVRTRSIRPFIFTPLDLDAPDVPPALLLPWLYAGQMTNLQSEPGLGKTWMAQWAAKQVAEQGHTVVYLDEEGGERLMRSRLKALRVERDAVDRIHYVHHQPRAWDDEDVMAVADMIADLSPALVVFDSLPDFLGYAGRDEDSSGDVTWFVNRVLVPFKEAGVAVLLLDHLPKPPSESANRTRSRYARGSGAKLAKMDCNLLLEQPEPFDRHRSGRLHLWKTKDRDGMLDLPYQNEDAAQPYDVTVMDGWVQFEASAPVSMADMNDKAVRAEILRAVGAEPLTMSDIQRVVPAQYRALVPGALSALAMAGSLSVTQRGTTTRYAEKAT